MRPLSIVLGLVAFCGYSAAVHVSAEAQPAGGVLKCATEIGASTTTYTDVTTLATPGSQCKSAILLAFDGNVTATNVREEIIELAVDRCGLWDGPYRGLLAANSGLGNPNYDYVVVDASTASSTVNTNAQTGSGDDPSVSAQIGVPGITLAAEIVGTTSNNSAVLTIDDISLEVPGQSSQSQILDFPGLEFVYAVKSQGQGNPIQATLICAVNAWYWSTFPGDPEVEFGGVFGISNYPFTHNVSSVTAGWGGGPSGLVTQANITSVCEDLNNAANQLPTDAAQFPNLEGDTETAQQQYTGKIFGTYKNSGTDPLAPTFNVSNCSVSPAGYERVCTGLEDSGFGRPNSCAPDGGTASGASSIIQTQSGLNTHCAGHYSFSKTFSISSFGDC